MPKRHTTPFSRTLFDTTIDHIVVPEDVAHYIERGLTIARYRFHDEDYGHIFFDNVADHVKRMVLFTQSLDIPESMQQNVARTAWIHDIPEIINSQSYQADVTTIDKLRNPALARKIREQEQHIMDEHFWPKDRQLFAHFETAKDAFLDPEVSSSDVGMLSKFIDMIDSINGFQVFIVEYLTSDGYRSTLPLPKQDAFEYCFQTFFPIYTGLDQLPPKHKRVWKIIQHVLEEDFFRFTQELWTPVALARLPEYAQIEYQKYLKKLTSIDFSK